MSTTKHGHRHGGKHHEEEPVEKTPEQKCVDLLEGQLQEKLDLFECCKFGFEKKLTVVLESLKNKDGVEKESGNTAAMLAAKNGHLACIKLLDDAGCDLNAKGYFGLTALHFAVRFDKLSCTKYLCEEKNVKLDIEDDNGNTPIHDAARMGSLKCIEILINKGANKEHTNKAGRTALMAASLNARGALVDFMLRQGSNINAVDLAGNTALHAASEAGLDRMITMLLMAKARVDIINLAGKLAADVCRYPLLKQKILDAA